MTISDKGRARHLEKPIRLNTVHGIASARSNCRVCFSRTWCCRHVEHERYSPVAVDRIICVCGKCEVKERVVSE